MARTYSRDAWGRFASRGGAPAARSRDIRLLYTGVSPQHSIQPRFTGQVLKTGAGRGTAKPKGTISGTAYGRSRDQFIREMGGGRGAQARIVRRGAPDRIKARTVDGWSINSAPRGTVSARRSGRQLNQEVVAMYGSSVRGVKRRGRAVGRSTWASAKRAKRK